MAFTSDGETLLVLADLRIDERYELFAIPTDGSGPPLVLNHSLSLNGTLTRSDGKADLRVTPDLSQIVYRAADPEFALYAAAIDGSGTLLLHDPIDKFQQVGADFRVMSDSRRVVFRSELNTQHLALWQTRIDSPGRALLRAGPFEHATEVLDFEIIPDESQVIYRADQDSDGIPELYAFPLGKSTRLR